MTQSYKQLLHQIKTFIFDVDGVLTNGQITITPNGELTRQMNIKDGYALKKALHSDLRICIISGGTNEGVRKRLNLLGIEDVFLGIHDKVSILESYVEKNNLDPKNIAYMGDDIPDLQPMKKVGLPCCPQDAAPEIKEISLYVSHKKGGEGCVRDILEQTLKVQNKWL